MGHIAKVSDLIGKTLTKVTADDDEIIFVCEDGSKYSMHHDQECMEGVYIENIEGDLIDLIGTPILLADETTNSDDNVKPEVSDSCMSFTWTFYRFATIKGYVTIRWFGESSGYYSETVSFERISSTI